MSKIIGCFSFLAGLSEDPDWVDFLRELKRERRRVTDWNCRQQRREFLGRFDGLIRDWHGQLPDLRDIFRRSELELLLRDTIHCYGYPGHEEAEIILGFIARTGYRHKYRYDKRNGKPLRIYTSPLHLAAKRSNMKGWDSVVEALFKIYNGFDCNYEERSTGLTHFHVACMTNSGRLVKKFLDAGCDPNLLVKSGESPLQLACKRACKQTIEMLLRAGAEPNHADKDGSTPLHMICARVKDQEGLVEMFFRVCDEMQREVEVDARNTWSNTPLNLALIYRNKEASEALLRRGADPKQVNKEGLTPLHFICQGDDVKRKKEDEVELIEVFFKVLDDIGQTVQLDAGNEAGNSPLHFALCYFNKKATEILLRRGANPNATNASGETPLHIICCCGSAGESHEIAKLFFEVTDELGKRVELDAVNNLGHCALQLAVVNPDPDLLDLLLDRGAHVPDTFFPPGSYFDHSVKDWGDDYDFKLRLVADAMCCIERLEARSGRRVVDRFRAPLIMTLIAEYNEILEKEETEGRWWGDDEEEFAAKAKEIRVNEELSLYELILLPDEEAAKRVTYEEYREFARANKLWLLDDEIYREACAMHMCKNLSREFFKKI